MGRPRKIQAITNVEVQDIIKRAKRGETLEELNILAEKHNGMLTPHVVVREASSSRSRLHHLFDWNDSTAAQKYRLMQARLVLTTVKVVYQGERREAFFNARVTMGDNEKIQGYFPLDRVLTDKEIHADVLRQAVRDLEYAERKYQDLQELKGVINKAKLKKVKATIK